jgi:hypothetical protein
MNRAGLKFRLYSRSGVDRLGSGEFRQHRVITSNALNVQPFPD